ncbi:hypothetical protein [Cereibacter johrii]|uniref:hypothetical protein n=1 Tax=Cereibacter johrii TaxID=445629 RepID=UPI003CFB2E92
MGNGIAGRFHLLEDRPEGEEPHVVSLLLIRARDAQDEADVEGQRQIHVRKLLLGVEVGPTRDDPPSILVGVDVPHVMTGVHHRFGVDLLQKGHR